MSGSAARVASRIARVRNPAIAVPPPPTGVAPRSGPFQAPSFTGGGANSSNVPGGWFGGLLGVNPWWVGRTGGGGSGVPGAGTPVPGVTDGSDVAPGMVGEFMLLTTSVDFTPPSMSVLQSVGVLPPGDWDLLSFSTQSMWLQTTEFKLEPVIPQISTWMVGYAGLTGITPGEGESQSVAGTPSRALSSVGLDLQFRIILNGQNAGQFAVWVHCRRMR